MSSAPQVVCFGEILWDVLPSGTKPGGAPMNVAYHLRKLGVQPAMITRIGTDNYGKKLSELLTGQGIGTEYLQVDINHNTGVVYATPNEQGNMTYDIVYPAAWDFIEYSNGYADLLQGATYLVYGSLGSRNDVSKNTLQQLKASNIKKVLDINLRPPHFNKQLIEQFLAEADILKLNDEELYLITDWYGKGADIYEKVAWLQQQYHIPTIVVTRGSEGALLCDNGTIYEHKGYKVKVGDTVGSGDAFLAGLLSRFLLQIPTDKALAFACGVGALVASYTGACPDYDVAEIDQLMKEQS